MKQPRRFLVILGLAAAVVLATASNSPASVELVVNGGFESGDFTGWTHTLGIVSAGSGYEAFLGGPGLGGIEQDIATTQGEKYLLSFRLGNVDMSPSTWSDFRVSWGGQVLYDGGVSPMPMTSWSYEVTGGIGAATNLEFGLSNHTLYGDADLNGEVGLSDLTKVLVNWGQSGKVWGDGDFDYDATVGLSDLTKVLVNFGQSFALLTQYDRFDLDDVSVSAVVPEPAAIIVWSLLGMAAASYGLQRRRHGRDRRRGSRA